MKKKPSHNASDMLVDELQKVILNSQSLKKYHQESEKIISNLQLPAHFMAK